MFALMMIFLLPSFDIVNYTDWFFSTVKQISNMDKAKIKLGVGVGVETTQLGQHSFMNEL